MIFLRCSYTAATDDAVVAVVVAVAAAAIAAPAEVKEGT